MKGNLQLSQVPEPMEVVVVEGDVVVVVVVVVVLEGDVVVVEKLSVQVADSSPKEAKENLFCVMTLALSDTFTTPVGVLEIM